jgi:soluble lytic murein transglycosylase-like protein
VIDDPLGLDVDAPVSLFYNGLDVTRTYLSGSTRQLSNAGTRLEIVTAHLRLKASLRNRIEVRYLRAVDHRWVSARYKAPECRPFSSDSVRSTGAFDPPETWMKQINAEAKRSGLNPNLLAGLIAQESSFNPRALSWAKALGLTQVTPLADREIEKAHPEWPRQANAEDLSFFEIKALITTGRMTGRDDWRLDPSLSIQGGVNYLSYVGHYWQSQVNSALIQKTFASADDALVKLMLASYNSGASRVHHALRKKGSDFLLSPELNEAREYVNRIMSYCYHFSKEEPIDENST